MLSLNKLTYLYQQAPMQFDVNIAAGARVAMLGPSGAGKSTLLSLIAGFLLPNSGELWLNGDNHRYTPPAERQVSILFQENNLFPHLTLEQNIALGLHPGLRLTAAQRQALHAIAEHVGLNSLMQRLPAQVSGGQRQRAALARCLLRQRPVLLLDEPFSALDPALRQDMLTLVDRVCAEKQLTLLMATHYLDDALRIVPLSLLLVDGNIAYDGPTMSLCDGSRRGA
ncbi:thiamine ABC transporter ATP-binding protein ThiQ [Candidatus Symbiopectobacterium endolongispinus]|uniref:thiamine ABC transporter ATP-binding protein ThiQ n=1 Tax=Candidatus Symbiopectobacterium endolongispinus TaxID=2812664 RepID=UPI00207A10F3|nr:thiamine ABC transporter ATP-binding protein ThiQ [Candidatus Symbiopectobacterium endolongispinus]MBT9429007.1 thiamine ABC transporter ATP-binding protein ThiQ [Candidatus Symbiopectobacterium endolongispinus]